MESTWSLSGVHVEFIWSMWSPHEVHGVHLKYMESTWSPHGLHMDSIYTPYKYSCGV
jgi:hypothetical protein